VVGAEQLVNVFTVVEIGVVSIIADGKLVLVLVVFLVFVFCSLFPLSL
jgi:hypothetical protein